MIKLSDISISYPTLHIDKLNATFDKGINLIKGKSGCGKTTLINLIIGKVKPNSGKIDFDDLNINQPDLMNEYISYLPYSNFLLKKMSLCQQFDYFESMGIKISKDLFENLIEYFDFEYLKDKKLSKMSGGEIKQANLIFALAKKSKYLILDEPFAPLDKTARKKLKDYLISIRSSKCIILVDHSSCFDDSEVESSLYVQTKTQSINGNICPKNNKKEIDYFNNQKEEYSKSRKMKSLFKLSFSSFSDNYSSSFTIFLLTFLTAVLLMISVVIIPKSESQMNDFCVNNSPYQYIQIRDSLSSDDNELLDDLSDEIQILDISKNNYVNARLNDGKRIMVVGTSKAEKDNYIYTYSSNSNGERLFDSSKYDGEASLTFVDSGCLFDFASNCTIYESMEFSDLSNVRVDYLYCTNKTFDALIKDDFTSHLYTKDGDRIVDNVVMRVISKTDTRLLTIVDGENQFGLSGYPIGTKEKLTIFGGSVEKVTTMDCSSDTSGNYFMSADVYKKYCMTYNPFQTNFYGLFANKDVSARLEKEGVYILSPLSNYSSVSMTWLTISIICASFGGLLLIMTIGYLVFCEGRLMKKGYFDKLILLGLDKKDAYSVYLLNYGIHLLLSYIVQIVFLSISIFVLNVIDFKWVFINGYITSTDTLFNYLKTPLYYFEYSAQLYLLPLAVTLIVELILGLIIKKEMKKNA